MTPKRIEQINKLIQDNPDWHRTKLSQELCKIWDWKGSNLAYDFLANLQYRVKDLTAQVGDFKSGERYVKMQADHMSQLAKKDREIKGLKQELAQTRRQVTNVRNMWMQCNKDLVEAHAKELSQKDRKIEMLEN